MSLDLTRTRSISRLLCWTVATTVAISLTPLRGEAVQFGPLTDLQTGISFTTVLTFGPEDPDSLSKADGCVYAANGSGAIHRVCFDATKTVTSNTVVIDLNGVGTVDNVFIVFDVTPTEIVTGSDEGDYPEFLKKYMRYGVVSQAYGANTDGRIQSLASYWGARYEVGIDHTRRFVRNKRQDRDYRLTARATSRTRNRHPRLPSAFPATNP